MCGRSSLHDAPRSVLEHFSLPPVPAGFMPRYNIAPSQNQLTLSLADDGSPAVRPRRWGLIPSWSADPSIGNRLINARSDALMTRNSWKDSFTSRRCLVLADGYYEWSHSGKTRVPMFFHFKGHHAFAMAGLWDRWTRAGEVLETCTIITTDAAAGPSQVHHRMPALLDNEAAREWLEPLARPADALELLKPWSGSDLEYYAVSKLVNSPANDSPACIEPAEEPPQEIVSQLSLLPD